MRRTIPCALALMVLTAAGVLAGGDDGAAAAAAKKKTARKTLTASDKAALEALKTEAQIYGQTHPAPPPGVARAAVLESGAASSALLPGVGWDPFPGKPDPFPVGHTLPNEELLAAYIGRYGVPPGSNPARQGFCCELFGVNETALHNAWAAGQIGDRQHDGQTTLREMTDGSFVFRRIGFSTPGSKPPVSGNFYCQWWFAFTFPGGMATAPLHVNRADRPLGAFTEVHEVWNCPVFSFNDGATSGTGDTGGGSGGSGGSGGTSGGGTGGGGTPAAETCYVVDAPPGAVITPRSDTSVLVRPGMRSTASLGRAIVSVTEAPCPPR